MQTVDVLIHGSGVVGQCLALCLAPLGLRVVIRAPERRAAQDVRAYALNAASVALLRELRVWDALPAHAVTPVYDMRVEGDAAAVMQFSAWQHGVSELAWIVDVPALEEALTTALKFSPQVEMLPSGQEQPSARLSAICEGRHSALRDNLNGVEVHRHDYGQTAIAARFRASFPHAGTAYQWFRSPDILALLPCSASSDSAEPASAFALVWSVPTEKAKALMALPDQAFEAALKEALPAQVPWGELQLISTRAAWPLVRQEASAWCGPGWVLVGDAAHTVHPLAGQGLNLGLADVVALRDVLKRREPWRELGDPRLLRRYERQRLGPTRLMGGLTGGLMHLFSHPNVWVAQARNQGLSLVERLPGVKRLLMGGAVG